MIKNNIQLAESLIEYNPQAFRSVIGEAIRHLREGRGLTQQQLAEKMKISRTTISKIESGKFNLSIDYLSKFAFFLDFEIILQDSK